MEAFLLFGGFFLFVLMLYVVFCIHGIYRESEKQTDYLKAILAKLSERN